MNIFNFELLDCIRRCERVDTHTFIVDFERGESFVTVRFKRVHRDFRVNIDVDVLDKDGGVAMCFQRNVDLSPEQVDFFTQLSNREFDLRMEAQEETERETRKEVQALLEG